MMMYHCHRHHCQAHGPALPHRLQANTFRVLRARCRSYRCSTLPCRRRVWDTSWTVLVPSRIRTLQLSDQVVAATATCGDSRSHDVDAVSASSCHPLAAVGEAAVIGGGAVHVRRLQLHLAGGDGCVELYLSPMHDVEHQADADDDL